ncbi:MarR family winged helix-turn-helix transcriptional regulator [Nocardia sp. NPDC057353]|uniref:MarR family winged helix-turn-helix transcriptional regulator n=1 Tax=Nocardia sp. NPDC057353 TaxID=3346104 RepID=UPI00364045C6
MTVSEGVRSADTIEGWRRLVLAHDRLMRTFEAELKRDFGLTVAQYDVVHRLAADPEHPVRMSELAQALLYSSGAATKVLDRLTERGLVERVPDPADRRAVRIGLTDAGRELAVRARRAHGRSIARAVGPFESEAERTHVLAYLGRLAAEP